MKGTVVFVIALLAALGSCVSLGSAREDAYRPAGENETEIIIQRTEMPVYAGFKEWIYVDGKQKLVLTNGDQGRIIVPRGVHTIHAELYTLTSAKVTVTAGADTLGLMVTPYSLYDFAIEDMDEDLLIAAIQNTPPPPVARAAPPAEEDPPAEASAPAAREAASRPAVAEAPPAREVSPPPATASRPAARESAPKSSGRGNIFTRTAGKLADSFKVGSDDIEGPLTRAAEKLMIKIAPKTRMAIVYVTAQDSEIAEIIANELEFIMVDHDLTLIDRSQLDNIRKEQRFQLSGEVDDEQAVSIGKIAGAEVILIGAVTGSGDIRRLRLRALDTQSAQVMVAASERY
jgi:hypothetical protein